MKVGVLTSTFLALLIGFPIAASAGLAPDADGDGVPDVLDNCDLVQNAGVLDCDTDQDGFGNACDADYDANLAIDGQDFVIFRGDFTGAGDTGEGTDHNCDGAVDGSDFVIFRDMFTGAASGTLSSGLACASAVEGGCPN